ncbi:FadR/GntR family transcriptional regulator [Nocardioides acrostichi]|uniref:FadR family transcriptional regulator n=1 Tax=Nocardioides acrostichi TaxID=2784339 RepID=A0A930YCC5_9ACTN|nr:FadR/GntR family transcriptional regulator [Nocardioides acrostichi]MBF4163343.1 FadR family transcriptional regulator [Nocardioides acrostichi]
MSQTDIVVSKVKRMIVEGELRPGDRLPIEKELAERLGVSRSPLREGVRALAMMGVLQVRQGAGTFVTALDSELLLAPLEFVVELHSGDVESDLHTVRRVLETEACARAALLIDDAALERAEAVLAGVDEMLEQGTFDESRGLQADMEFHDIISSACGNPILRTLIGALSSKTVRARMWRALVTEGVSRSTHREHRAILEALREGDPERARLRMAVHLVEVEDFLSSPDAQAPDDLLENS